MNATAAKGVSMGKTQGHTEGPWKVELMDSEEGKIRTYREWRIYQGDGIDKPICDIFDVTGVGEANARLIAAAPELLKTAKNLIEALKTPDNVQILGTAILKAAGAIARAEGRAEA